MKKAPIAGGNLSHGNAENHSVAPIAAAFAAIGAT